MNEKGRSFTISILSLSLLTVMAGAAIAPALDVIQAHFSSCNTFLVQMIVSTPAIFIVIGNSIFPRLTSKFGVKTLCSAGLILYIAGGCAPALFDSIYIILILRALVGLGVGILMPLSTGLLAFYYPPAKLNKLMGYSSAMNQMGGVIATLLAGVLSGISWRFAFLVYLMGLLSFVLCIIFLPNDKIGNDHHEDQARPSGGETFRTYWPNIVAMFLLMTTFFIYATNFAMITIADGIIPHTYISIIMACMDFIAFIGGLAFAKIRKKMGHNTRFVAPVLFLAGYVLLAFIGGWPGTIAGSVCIGFANGLGIPFLIADASSKAGRNAVTTVIPMLSMALYLAQFACPAITSLATSLCGDSNHLPYLLACCTSILLIAVSAFIPEAKHAASEEKAPFALATLMKTDVYTVTKDQSIIEALEIFVTKKISGVPVLDNNGKLWGYISDGDILRYMSDKHAEFTNPYAYISVLSSDKNFDDILMNMKSAKIADAASRNIVTVDIDSSLPEVCTILSDHNVKKAPVMKDGKMVGVINISNLTKQAFARYVSAVK